jgi:hypothetical protein
LNGTLDQLLESGAATHDWSRRASLRWSLASMRAS